jgi:hypothetical protein
VSTVLSRTTISGAPICESMNSSLGKVPTAVENVRNCESASTSPAWDPTESPIDTSAPITSIE